VNTHKEDNLCSITLALSLSLMARIVPCQQCRTISNECLILCRSRLKTWRASRVCEWKGVNENFGTSGWMRPSAFGVEPVLAIVQEEPSKNDSVSLL